VRLLGAVLDNIVVGEKFAQVDAMWACGTFQPYRPGPDTSAFEGRPAVPPFRMLPCVKVLGWLSRTRVSIVVIAKGFQEMLAQEL